MKKILALVLALAMVLCAVSALAAGSPESPSGKTETTTTDAAAAPAATTDTAATDANKAPTTYTGGNKDTTEDELSLEIVDDDDLTTKVIGTFDANDMLAGFPDDLKAALDGLTKVNEMVSAKWNGDTTNATDKKVSIKFTTQYNKDNDGENVAVVAGKLGATVNDAGVPDVTWTKLEGVVEDNGNVEVTFPGSLIKELGNDIFVLAVVSK